ncbi:MAG: outer rane lipoprotein carrier protein LolA [Flavipsychrobacter sp.]|nr:outer rane lipoprotein carrier protein LolA [Flavipsychrobacter sp.]
MLNKMRKALLIGALVIGVAATPASAQNDPKAKAILESVTKKVNGLKSLKANFSISLTGKGGKVNETKKGSITLKGQKYHVLISGQEIISDNKTVWTYNKEAKEVQISNFNASEQTMSPAKLLTNFYDKEYKYSYKGEKKTGAKTYDLIDLQPLDKSKKYTSIELMIDKATSMIAGGNITEKNGNKVQYTVSNVVTNSNVPDTEFTWNAKSHAGVEAVDLR